MSESIDSSSKTNSRRYIVGSPINAALEKKDLERLGHSAVSEHKVVLSPEGKDLFKKLQKSFDSSF